jgi:hypothetical protein
MLTNEIPEHVDAGEQMLGRSLRLILRVVPKLRAAIDQSVPPDGPVSIDPNGY